MSGYCKYCGSLIDIEDIVREFDSDKYLVWVGCRSCYVRRKELKKNAAKKLFRV